jgi:predicted HicB family RNase H-like nuclease
MRNNLLSTDYHQSYLGQLRQLIGKRKIFAITARAIIQPEMHMAVATAAEVNSKSINQWATEVLKQAALSESVG